MEQTSIIDTRLDCLPEVQLKYGRLSDPGLLKAKRRRKYVFTDQIDQLIREIYLNHRDAKTRPGIRLLAKKVGMPHWALKKRARELGLSCTVGLRVFVCENLAFHGEYIGAGGLLIGLRNGLRSRSSSIRHSTA